MSQRPNMLSIVLVVLIVVAGIAGYFAGSATAPQAPPSGVATVTVTATKTATVTTTATQGTPSTVYKWRMVSAFPSGEPRFDVEKYFVNLVKNMSNGRLIIELYPGGELFPVPQTFDMVSRGTVDAAAIFLGYWVAEDPVMALGASIPGPQRTPDDVLYIYRATEDILRKHIEARGVLLVGPLDIVPSEVLVSRVPIRTLDDIKGKIIRTAGLSAKIYEKLGAKVVTLTAGEIYQALQLGTIDALEWADYEADYILGYHEVAKYVLEAPPGYSLHSGAYPDSILILNPNSWNNLPDDLKEIVKGAAKAAYTWGIERTYFMAELRGRQLWKNAGAEITVLSPEECKKIISVSMDIYVGLAKQHADAKDFIVRLAKAWNDLGYAEWARALENALRAEGLI